MRAARVHLAARRRGGVAVGGAGAAAGAGAAHRRAHKSGRGRPGGQSPPLGVLHRPGAIGLERRSQPADRHPLGQGDDIHKHAAELASLAPDILLAANGTATVAPLLQATRTVPIVFVNVIDPVGAGFVASLAQPGGNATGFTIYEYSMSGKWLEMLKEIAPNVKRVAVLRDPALASGIGQFGAVQTVAPSLGVELSPVDVRDAREIDRAVTTFARGLNGGLVVTAAPLAAIHRDAIIALAARHRLPAVYPYRFFVDGGGLISYGPDTIDQYRRAASYVDRILKGQKPADLPVQAPTKYEVADQSQDRQGARPHRAADAARPRR